MDTQIGWCKFQIPILLQQRWDVHRHDDRSRCDLRHGLIVGMRYSADKVQVARYGRCGQEDCFHAKGAMNNGKDGSGNFGTTTTATATAGSMSMSMMGRHGFGTKRWNRNGQRRIGFEQILATGLLQQVGLQRFQIPNEH